MDHVGLEEPGMGLYCFNSSLRFKSDYENVCVWGLV